MRILTLDIETSPITAHTWGLWDQNISLNQIVRSGSVICFAAKWHDSKTVMFFRDDIVGAAWELLDQADVVVHFNGKRFDIPWLNAEFVRAGMSPPSPYKQIDLFQVVKSRFKFPSNKLQYVATALGLPGKADTGGFDLWVQCMAGQEKAWRKMRSYNKQDVLLTEQVYDRLLPWIGSHPSAQLYDGHTGCPRCASRTGIQKRGFAYTKVSKFQQYNCLTCGSYFRDNVRVGGVKMTESVA